MVRSRHESSFGRYTGRRAAFLQPSSRSFGSIDGRRIERSFVATARRLREDLLLLVHDLAAGNVDVQRFVVHSRARIRLAYYRAYSLGALSIFSFYTMTDRDLGILDHELDSETGFLRQFAADIADHQLDSSAVSRAGLYLLALRGIFERGRLEAMPQGPYRWQLGITEHCSECYQAASHGPYQRTRQDGLGLPPIPGSPGDGSVCLGLTRCGCTVVLASGHQLPNADIAEILRGRLLEVINGPSSTPGGAGTN